MKREISYSEGKTIQESSYEPRSFHFSAKMELNAGEDMQESYDALKKQVHSALEREIMKWRDPQRFVRTRLKENDVPFNN